MISVDTSQLTALAAQIGAAAARVTPAAAVAVDKGADEAFALSQALVPVLTGELKGSGNVAQTGPLSAEITYGTDHAGYVEYGTSDTAPQPYLNPVADPGAEAIADALLDIVDGLL